MFCRKLGLCLVLIIVSSFVSAQSQKWPSTFLWRISGNGLVKPSYMYGTIHLADIKLFNFGDSLYYHLERAEGLNIEVDGDSLVSASVKQWSENDNGRTLKNILSKYKYQKYAGELSKTLKKPADKITAKDILKLKNQRMNAEFQKGEMSQFMDFYFYGVAKRQGKVVGGIENLEDQLNLLEEDIKETDLDYVISDSLQQLGDLVLETMKEIYIKEDLAGIEAFSLQGDEAKRQKILDRRNEKMALRMDSIARLRSTFFAIGVAHLPGNKGLVTLLREKGFTVEPVFSTKKIPAEKYTYQQVHTAWKPYAHPSLMYSAKFPGTPQQLDALMQVMDMQFYYDIPYAKSYFTGFVLAMVDVNKKDSIFNEVIKRMVAGGKLVSQKNILKQGYEGRDVHLVVESGDLVRVQVFIAGDIAYTVAISSKKKAELYDIDSETFFSNFMMTPQSSDVKPYVSYLDTAYAFSILLPHANPAVQESPANSESGSEMTIVSNDYNNGISYIISINNVKPGSYLLGDTSTMAMIKKGFVATMNDDVESREVVLKGMPALWLNGTVKDGGAYMRTLTLLRGNMGYTIACAGKKAALENPLTDTFFNSFRLLELQQHTWRKYLAPDSSFFAWLPGPFVNKNTPGVDDIEAGYSTGSLTQNEFLSYDPSTANSYHILREYFSPYYFTTSDSAFFEEHANRFKEKGDSMILFTVENKGNKKVSDVVLSIKGSLFQKRIRFLLHGDTLYQLYSYLPKWYNNENVEKYFNEFAINSVAPATTLFTNKTQQLVADLQSGDSATFFNASNYLYDAQFSNSNLDLLHPLLIKRLQDFEDESYYNSNTRFVDAMAKSADSSTVNFIKNNYHELKDEDKALQYHLLKLLVKMDDPFATEAALELLQSPNPPGGNVHIFSYALSSSLPFAKTIFPQLISFTKDSTAAFAFADIIIKLIDSSLVKKEEVPLTSFINVANKEREKLNNGNGDYDYRLHYILDIFATIGNAESWKQLQSFTSVPNLNIVNYVTGLLLQNDQPIDAEIIFKLAASDDYRATIYESLTKANKAKLFPAKYLNQEMFARSYLSIYAFDDYSLKSIEIVNEKIAEFKGKLQKFYLYKAIFEEEAEMDTLLGVAGPFPINRRQVTSDNTATGVIWDEPFSPAEVNQQFKAYLKQLETIDMEMED